MSAPRLRSIIQYVFIIGLTVTLVWYSLRGIQGEDDKWEYLKQAWMDADKGWLIAMAVVAIASHVVRAMRWKMLMEASDNTKQRLSHSFLSLMVGYFINLLIPRGGELSRCFNLYKLNRTPVEISFGTVILERIVDVICLGILIVFSFALESSKLVSFIDTLPIGTGSEESRVYALVIVGVAGVAACVIAYLVMRRNEKIREFVARKWLGFREGLFSVFRLRDKKLFVFYSILIWFLYFVMSYTVIMAFEATSVLGWSAVLSLFAVGAIAMAVPLPGGTGSYHVLVPQSLVFLYHVPEADAVAFTFIFHGWQTVIMIAGGALSLLITTMMVRKKPETAQN